MGFLLRHWWGGGGEGRDKEEGEKWEGVGGGGGVQRRGKYVGDRGEVREESGKEME